MTKVELSIVLACFNEGPTFEKNVRRIVSVLKKQKLIWEIIFVEDKSSDETRNTVEKLSQKIGKSKIIYHSKNKGRGKSVTDGLMISQGSICGFLDVDCEIDPSYIPVFVGEIEKGNEMAIATRFYEKGTKYIARYLASRAYSMIVKRMLGLPFVDTEAGFKFFRKEKIKPVLARTKDKRWFWDTEICARAHRAGLAISEVPVLFIRRPDKKSTVRLFRDSLEYWKKLLEFRLSSE